MRVFPLLAVLLFGLVAPVQADQQATADVAGWLKRMAAAERQHSYQGTFAYERNGSFSTHGIWHRVEANGQVRERLLQLDGPAQEVVRINGRPQCVSGSPAEQLTDVVPPALRRLAAEQLVGHYDLRIVGESRVAGRSAVVLLMLPRDRHRYGFELHLDRLTALPLKSLMLSEQGQLLERFQFTQLDTLTPLSEQALRPSVSCLPIKLAPAALVTVNHWHSSWLPAGFNLLATHERSASGAEAVVTWLMFGDGLARFSVFIEPLQGESVVDTRTQLGPTAVVSKRMPTAAGEFTVTVVGEIPPGTAERVALAMRPAQESAQ